MTQVQSANAAFAAFVAEAAPAAVICQATTSHAPAEGSPAIPENMEHDLHDVDMCEHKDGFDLEETHTRKRSSRPWRRLRTRFTGTQIRPRSCWGYTYQFHTTQGFNMGLSI